MNLKASACILVVGVLLKCSDVFINGSTMAKSGPFVVNVVSAYPCRKPIRPTVKDAFIYFNAEIYRTTSNNSLMRGNITILKENRNIKIKSKRHLWENGKWNLVFVMNNIGCQGVLMEVLFTGVGVKIDKKKCGLVQGSYSFKDLDPNNHLQSWISEMEYGRMLWKFEIFTQSGSAFCWEFESTVSPKIK